MATDMLLDSGILIRHLRNNTGYISLTDQLAIEHSLFISVFTRFEVLRGLRKHERGRTEVLLETFISLPIDNAVADLAGELVRNWKAKNKTLSIGDVLIAATALHHELDLVTTNARHFPMPELTVWQADEEGHLSEFER